MPKLKKSSHGNYALIYDGYNLLTYIVYIFNSFLAIKNSKKCSTIKYIYVLTRLIVFYIHEEAVHTLLINEVNGEIASKCSVLTSSPHKNSI